MATHRLTMPYRGTSELLVQAALGGLIGGMLMGMASMMLFPLLGYGGFWQPINLIAAVVNRSWGDTGDFEAAPVLTEMMIHMAMSLMLGVTFAWVVGRSHGFNVWAVAASLAVWAVAHFAVLPFLDPIMARRFPYWLFAMGHALYGLGLGGYLAWATAARPVQAT